MATRINSTNVTFPNSSTQRSGLPNGAIILWSGAIIDIPTGWALCDGTNGTPDFRDRFVVGAGSTYSIGATGGAASVTLTESNMPPHSHGVPVFTINAAGSHSHTASPTNTTGAHTHAGTALRTPGGGYGGAGGTLGPKPSGTSSAGSHSHPASASTHPSHTHTITASMGPAGSGTSHNNLPPFYALAYIMEIA